MTTSKTNFVRFANQRLMATRDIESASIASEGTILN